MPKIGVIMRTKDRPILLERALKSVCKQTFKDWHLALVNDGGDPDSVKKLVSALPEKHQRKITQIDHPESIGMEAASNAGLAVLDSRYAIVHDDDDSLHPEFFSKTSHYLDHPPHPSVKGVITRTERIIEVIKGDKVKKVRSFPYNAWLHSISLRRMLAENVFAPIAFLFNRETCVEIGAFRDDLPVLGDWDFNVRFLCKHDIGIIDETLAYYHDREGNGTDAYFSSIRAKAHLHAFFDNFLRNEWLRDDIASGRAGKGLIANESKMLWDLSWDIKQEFKKKRFKLFK